MYDTHSCLGMVCNIFPPQAACQLYVATALNLLSPCHMTHQETQIIIDLEYTACIEQVHMYNVSASLQKMMVTLTHM